MTMNRRDFSWISPGGFKAFEFHQRIGRKRVAERIAALNTQCKEGLAKIPRVKLITPKNPALSAGLIAWFGTGTSDIPTSGSGEAREAHREERSRYGRSQARC